MQRINSNPPEGNQDAEGSAGQTGRYVQLNWHFNTLIVAGDKARFNILIIVALTATIMPNLIELSVGRMAKMLALLYGNASYA